MNILMPINVLTKIFTASYHKKDKGKVILKPGLLKHLLNLIPAPCSALFTYLEAWRVHQSIPTPDAPLDPCLWLTTSSSACRALASHGTFGKDISQHYS